MAHRSKLAGIVIDCRTDEIDKAARFWSEALGYPIRQHADPADQNYVGLDSGQHGLMAEVQVVEHESHVHIDIETDDIEAEARRLEALGAKRVGNIRTWCVMEAPTGQRFCLVGPQTPDFTADAHRWD